MEGTKLSSATDKMAAEQINRGTPSRGIYPTDSELATRRSTTRLLTRTAMVYFRWRTKNAPISAAKAPIAAKEDGSGTAATDWKMPNGTSVPVSPQ